MMPPRDLKIFLAQPRGFCSGVDRAIKIVEQALNHYGAPVYVRHEIVHNPFVVSRLREKGAIFVNELSQIPDSTRPVIFSAHGVCQSVRQDAKAKALHFIDATCPLVSKVHHEAHHHHAKGRHLVLIGHQGHPEVIGTLGQVPHHAISLVEDTHQAENLQLKDPENCAYVTQTTLSVDDTADIIGILKKRFPLIKGPGKEDICYATTNRQKALKEIAPKVDLCLVLGAKNSSNANRLREIGQQLCPGQTHMIDHAGDIDWSWFDHVTSLGLTTSASTPEDLLQELVQACRDRFHVHIETVNVAEENITFQLPAELR